MNTIYLHPQTSLNLDDGNDESEVHDSDIKVSFEMKAST